METVWKCPLCGSGHEQHRFFARAAVRFHPNPIQITYAICEECGLVFLWDRLNEKEAEEYYMKGTYRAIIQGTPAITQRVIDEQTLRTERLLPLIDEEPTSVLDVGASTGIWLDALKEKFDCKILGIEPGEHFRLENPYGVKMYSEMALLYTPNYYNSFDMITVIHVLEHMNDPLGFLTSLHEFITEDGSLFVEVPNMLTEVVTSISHPICFTPETLTYALQRTGWEIEWLKEYNGIKSRTLPPNILVKAKPGQVKEFIKKPDLETLFAAYEAGQEMVTKDRAEWEKKKS